MNKILIDKIKEIKLSGYEFCREMDSDCGSCPFSNEIDDCTLATIDDIIHKFIKNNK